MEKMQIFLSSKTIELSDRKNYVELLNRVCYYGAPNGNMVELPYDESTIEKAKTLEGMPVYAKYTTAPDGNPTFKGHEVSLDANGEIILNTIPIGVHMSVEIKNDAVETSDGSTVILPCLFARQKIWKRNKFAIAAVKRLFDEGKLHNSWEIETYEYAYKDGVKRLLDYIFDGNCFLGPEYASPAYGDSAEVISLSAKQSEMLVAEALAKDVFEASDNSKGNEVEKMDEETIVNELDIGGVENAEKEETAAPERAEETRPAEGEGQEKEVTSIAESVAEPVVEPIVEINPLQAQFEEATTQIEKLKIDLDAKNSALIESQKQINELTATINDLQPYKAAAEQVAREKAESQRQESVSELRKYAEKSGMLTKEELDSEEIAELIKNLKETEIKVLISDRIVAKSKDKIPEIASQKQPKVRTILSDGDSSDPGSILKTYVRK